MVRRYVTTIRCTDNTAELTLNAFNEQVGIVTVQAAGAHSILLQAAAGMHSRSSRHFDVDDGGHLQWAHKGAKNVCFFIIYLFLYTLKSGVGSQL